jgi:hypothetical protein
MTMLDGIEMKVSMTVLIRLHESLFHCSEAGFLPPLKKGGGGGFPEVRGHRRRRKSPLAPLFQRGNFQGSLISAVPYNRHAGHNRAHPARHVPKIGVAKHPAADSGGVKRYGVVRRHRPRAKFR